MSKKIKLIIAMLSVLKLWLIAAIPITAIGTASHDDRLYLNLAHSFAQGEWLGVYNQLTLAKGPMYSIWLAFNFHMGLPLLFAQHILYLCAGLMLVIALRQVIKSSIILVFLYALVIFSPHLEEITRVVREGIYPALSVLVLVCLVGFYTNRSNKLFNFGLWATFLGVVLTAFWLTREEGVWIMPSVLLMIAYVVFLTYRTEQLSSALFKRTAICLLPLLILFGGLQLVSIINKIYYNTYTVVEVKSKSFLSAYGALSRVKHPNWKRYLPVPKEVRQSIYRVSPAFKELEYLLEERLKGWQYSHGCSHYPETCGDIAGGWFMWALREAVALAGYHKSGDRADRYYSRLAKEINTACTLSLLNCLPKRATLIPPLTQAYLKPSMEAFWRGIKLLVMGFDYRINNNFTSNGPEELLVLFRDMTRERLAPLPSKTTITIRGWGLSRKDEKVYFQVRSQESGSLENFSFERHSSADVYQYVKKQTGKDYEFAKNASFVITSSCLKQCDLLIFDNRSLLAIVDLDKKEAKVFSDVLQFRIDAITIGNQKEQLLPRQNYLNQLKIGILKKIAQLYQLVIPWLCGLAIMAYMVSFGIGILRRQFTFLFILNTAILGAMIARLLILALIDVTSFPAINFLYMSPLFPFLLTFLVLAITDVMQESIIGSKVVKICRLCGIKRG